VKSVLHDEATFGIHAIDKVWHRRHTFTRPNPMASIYEKLGSRIRQLRKQQHLSQEDLATKAKLDLTSISEIESGLRNPSLKTLNKIALALRVPLAELFQ
jgi:DNA-binding XRE family transcriptional regulator